MKFSPKAQIHSQVPSVQRTLQQAYTKIQNPNKQSAYQKAQQEISRKIINNAMELVAIRFHKSKAKVVQAFATNQLQRIDKEPHEVEYAFSSSVIYALKSQNQNNQPQAGIMRQGARFENAVTDFKRWLNNPLQARKAVAIAVVKSLASKTYEIEILDKDGNSEFIKAKRLNSDPFINQRLVHMITYGYREPEDFGFSAFEINRIMKAAVLPTFSKGS